MAETAESMRILMLSHHALGRGADFLRAWYLGEALVAQGHRVTLVCAPAHHRVEAGNWFSQGILEVLTVGDEKGDWFGQFGRTLFGIPQRALALSNRSFDVVHTFGPRPETQIPASLVAKQQSIPLVADWSDWWGYGGIADQRSLAGKLTVGLMDHVLEQWTLKSAAGVTVVNQWAKDRIINQGQVPDRVLNLGVGASVNVIQPLAKNRARRKLGIGAELDVVGYSGLSAFDQPLLKDTLGQLARINPDLRFLLLGRSREQWHSLGVSAALIARSIIIDHVPHHELGGFLACVDLMLLPLPTKGLHLARMPLRLGDYMAAGRPVIASGGGDAASLVVSKGIGWSAEPKAASIAKLVLNVLMEKSQLAAVGQHARRIAEQEYAWSIQAARLADFYQSLR